VGKTAIAEGLAKNDRGRAGAGGAVRLHVVYSLDMGALLAGTKYRGDFEKRFKGHAWDLPRIPGHPVHRRGAHHHRRRRCLRRCDGCLQPDQAGAVERRTALHRFHHLPGISRVFEKDHALARRFQKIDVVEPTVESLEILKGLKSRFEEHHKVSYTDEALRAAVELAARYINERQLPDKAIDVIDEAGASQRLSRRHAQAP
jgi:ATP-dependent Clp protease ATP-binding subunit ClpA